MKNIIYMVAFGVLNTLLCLNTFVLAQDKDTDNKLAQNCLIEADDIVGVYYVIEEKTREESKIRIDKDKDGSYFAQVIWMKEPNMPDGSPKKDFNNPDKELRKVNADKIVMMKGLKYNPKNQEWEDGKVYNPLNGKMYKGYMKFVDKEKLKVRGYLGFSMLGKTMYWTKIK